MPQLTSLYTKLKVGDVRQQGDLFERKANLPEYDGAVHGKLLPVRLVGSPILPSDLIADDFFRP